MIDLNTVEKEFDNFVNQYEKQKKIILKKEHTKRVSILCNKISTWFAEIDSNKEIIEKAGGKEEFINLATTIGWLHDIGRFEQAKKFDSFNDKKTFDHAHYGVEVLKKDNYISKYCEEEKFYNTIYKAVENHNKKYIESGLNEFDLSLCKIVRDADKLDIYNVFTNRIAKNEKEKQIDNLANKKIISDLLSKKIINTEDVIYELDYYLLSLGFAYDINYKKSYQILKEEDYINLLINKIENHITKENIENMEIIRDLTNNYIDEKIIEN